MKDLEKITGGEDLVGGREEKIKLLVSEGLTREEIAEKLSMNYPSFCTYLSRHPELPKPIEEKRGRLKGSYDLEKYEQIKELIELGLSQSEIAKKINVSQQAINEYLDYHPELQRQRDSRRSIINQEKYEQAKELIDKGLTREEIVERLGIKYPSFCAYLSRHQELPRPIRKKMKPQNLEEYEQIKSFIKEGLNQTEVARKLGISHQAVNEYIHRHRLKYSDARVKKGRFEEVLGLIEGGLTRKEIAKKIGINYGSLVIYISQHLEFSEIKNEKRNYKRYDQIKQMLEEGFSQLRIARILGYKSNSIVTGYIGRHLELREIYDSHRRQR